MHFQAVAVRLLRTPNYRAGLDRNGLKENDVVTARAVGVGRGLGWCLHSTLLQIASQPPTREVSSHNHRFTGLLRRSGWVPHASDSAALGCAVFSSVLLRMRAHYLVRPTFFIKKNDLLLKKR